MEKTNARKFKWFWPWQNEQEEGWLREMSQEGWHLRSTGTGRWRRPVGLLGLYSFVVGDPRDYVYRLDPQDSLKHKQDYLQLLRDAGWESMGAKDGCQYFRKEGGPEEFIEIHTNVEPTIGNFKRQLAVMVLPTLAIFVVFFFPVLFKDTHLADSHPWWRIIVWLVLFLAILGWSFTILGVLGRIRRLRRRRTVQL